MARKYWNEKAEENRSVVSGPVLMGIVLVIAMIAVIAYLCATYATLWHFFGSFAMVGLAVFVVTSLAAQMDPNH